MNEQDWAADTVYFSHLPKLQVIWIQTISVQIPGKFFDLLSTQYKYNNRECIPGPAQLHVAIKFYL